MPLLPFLKDKNRAQGATGVIIKHRAPDSPEAEQDDSGSAMHAAAQDILRAISDNDPAHLAQALQAAFDIHTSTPNEGPSLEDDA